VRKQKDDMQVNVAGLRRNIKNLAHNYSDAQVSDMIDLQSKANITKINPTQF